MWLRCISTWMSTGSVRSYSGAGAPPASTSVTCQPLPCLFRGQVSQIPGESRAASPPVDLDVEEPDILCVSLDERPPCFDVLAHQHAEQLVGLRRVVERHLPQDALGRVHRGFPQLARVHLAQALVPLDAVLRPRVPATRLDARLDDRVPLPVGVDVVRLHPAPLPLDLV